jgi:beta-glucosidase
MKPGEKITATMSVTNTGSSVGAEVVQLYLRDLVGSVTRLLLELKGFRKIMLNASESREVSFTISEKELQFLRADMTWGTEPGEFQTSIGPNSLDLHPVKFKLLPQ